MFDATMSHIGGEMAGVKVLSFDVFDTLVVRSCGPPEALFLLLGRWAFGQGLTRVSPETFARQRARAEAAVWEQRGGLDTSVHLRDFYLEMMRRSGFSEGLVELLVEAELRMEARLLQANPIALEWLKRGRELGCHVIAVSDIYLTAKEVSRLLEPLGVLPLGGLFTSHDAQASKASGRLYGHVATAVGVPSERILHVGDKFGVDVRRAREAGWRAHLLADGQLTRHEACLAESRWENEGLGSVLAGAARRSRLELSKGSNHSEVLTAVGASPAAGLVIGYVLWVLRRARDHGLSRLGFLARDGQVLAAVARVLSEQLEIDIDIRYLHVSRRATNLAGVYALAPEDVEWILRHSDGQRVDDVLGRVGLDALSIALLPEGVDGGTPVSGHVRSALATLLEEPSVAALIVARARAQRPLVSEYLKEQGFLEPDGGIGIVDLGGVGSQVRSLSNIICAEAGAAPRIFLLGLDQHADPKVREAVLSSSWLQQTECWIFDQVRDVGELKYRGLVSFAHVCCGADHPTVHGYVREDGAVVPAFEPDASDELARWGRDAFQAAIVTTAEKLDLSQDMSNWEADLRPAIRRGIELLWEGPTHGEAVAIGSYPFESGEATVRWTQPLARPYRFSDAVRGSFNGSYPDRSWTRWHAASVAISPRAVRLMDALLTRLYEWTEGTDSGLLRPLLIRVRMAARRIRGR